jgi:CRISPR-associated endoribonuclease Cas6
MRLKLVLHQTEKRVALPINTGYLIGSAIYRTLANASPEFATRMHEYGYGSPGARQNFRLFTFSNLDIPKRSIQGSRLVSESEHISFLISSPMEDFLQLLITGLFSDGHLRLENVAFQKERIETLPDPSFSATMSFTMLSPMTMSVTRQGENGNRIKEWECPRNR